jgi:hypothetical protein
MNNPSFGNKKLYLIDPDGNEHELGISKPIEISQEESPIAYEQLKSVSTELTVNIDKRALKYLRKLIKASRIYRRIKKGKRYLLYKNRGI